ncbi:NAD(P)H-dependent oxidoreductase [Tenacibaculum jejuense]|uniref:NAD(P)H dehydrogenase (Quinone) n=1 Tax=Tenacibaculum jejuense TaxID=584609 RepID=A0A238UF70_9FLAO|nr:NAD(P)H-dependent oxidoreductase [Tenacibaculum jejuense]SNR17228.1 NAD(P)H dehydrogenase (Quinone) [Tenacibaculum jejuense]
MNVVIINGHPNKESFNNALANTYYQGVKSTQNSVEIINVRELDFNPNLQFGYRKRTELEPGLQLAIEKIKAADHLVWVLPVWWGGMPAMLKGFIDRTFLPGIMFDIEEEKFLPKKLLKGKTARLIITSDSPRWYYYLYLKSPVINQLKKGILAFCGVKPTKLTYIAPIKNSTQDFRKEWLNKVFNLGKNLK